MVLTVYVDPCTINCRKVLAGLQLLGTDYEVKNIDYFGGEHKSDAFRKINPCMTVPAATDGDLVITESNAILQYAADLRAEKAGGGKGDEYYPKDLKKRADVNRWLLWEASRWFACCYVYLIQNVVQPLSKKEPDQSVLDNEADTFDYLANILNERLNNSKFLNSDNVTIADIAVAAPMHVWRAQKLPMKKFPSLERWIQDVEKLDCWKNTQKAVDDALGLSGVQNQTNGSNGVSGKTVRASINYTKDVNPQLTELYFYETDKAKGIHEPGDDPRVMGFTDGWHRVKDFSHDKEGFSLHSFGTGFEDWEDDESVRNRFYPEIVEWLKKTIGAKRVLVFDHTIRTQKNQQKKLTQETNTSQRAPVMLVHCDYTSESGPLRVRQLLGDEAEELLKGRVAFLNVWKPIHNIVEERPLAMCDITSTSPSDFFKLHLRYRDRNGENYVMRHNDKHKWWYFPQMTPEQVILLKCFDSDEGRARFVGHTAFEDPTTKEGAKVRESVEIRTIAFF